MEKGNERGKGVGGWGWWRLIVGNGEKLNVRGEGERGGVE